jgi:CRP-like cAMP-binding protein
MRKALYILGHLNDSDANWLAAHGVRRKLVDGEVIIRAGMPVDGLYISLEGALGVKLADGQAVAKLGPGEIIGEIAFVDSALPTATVFAIGAAVVLEVDKKLLQQHMQADVGFAARFYQAVAIFLADRLRATTQRLGYGKTVRLDQSVVQEDELDETILDKVSEAGERFDRLLRMVATER